MSQFRHLRRILPVTLVALAGCRDTFAAFGAGAHGRASAGQFFDALAARHAENSRNPKYEIARMHIARAGLSPSRVYDDTAAWTSMASATHTLETFGSLNDTRYHMAARPNIPAPARLADGKHVTTLTHLQDGEYRWDLGVDYAIGSARPADLAMVFARLLSAGEGRTEHEVRDDLRTAAPRTSVALGTLFSLDTLHPTLLPDGTTAVTVGISVHSDNLRPRFPAFAEYVRRYHDPARFRFVITDRAGTPYLEAVSRDRFLAIKLRTQHGGLVPLSGPPRPLPDSLLLHADFNVKVKVFRVGFHSLVMDLVKGPHTERELDWTFTAHREPQWELPFIVGRLIRAPLRRPFAGEGSSFRIGLRAAEPGGQARIARHSRLYVQESGILNFLNSLGSTAVDDFAGSVEKEENMWLRELFVAMRDDALGALHSP
jgi:hypothetical protein